MGNPHLGRIHPLGSPLGSCLPPWRHTSTAPTSPLGGPPSPGGRPSPGGTLALGGAIALRRHSTLGGHPPLRHPPWEQPAMRRAAQLGRPAKHHAAALPGSSWACWDPWGLLVPGDCWGPAGHPALGPVARPLEACFWPPRRGLPGYVFILLLLVLFLFFFVFSFFLWRALGGCFFSFIFCFFVFLGAGVLGLWFRRIGFGSTVAGAGLCVSAW